MNATARAPIASPDLTRAAWFALATLLLTTVHHVYGAYAYDTPWRLHVGFVSGLAGALIIGAALVVRRRSDDVVGRIAFWSFLTIALVVPVIGIGLFEGAYNHLLKDALYFAGTSPARMRRLFPPPRYEMPDDAFFEISGILQIVPAALTAWYLRRMTFRGRTSRTAKVHAGDAVAPRQLLGIRDEAIRIPQPDRLVHLQFRRFAGCPVCNRHLQSFVRRRDEIGAAGIQEVIVFHSTAEELRRYESDLPFAVVGDPGKRLYSAFGVEAAPRALLDPHVWVPIIRAVLHSLVEIIEGRRPVPPMRPDGGSLGLPADFLIAPDGRVTACKYGAHADDQWSVDDLLRVATPSLDPALADARSGSSPRRIRAEVT